MGSSALDGAMETIAKTSLVKNKRIILKHFSSPEDISYCHILFIPRESQLSVKTVSEQVDKKVLIVSEKAGAARQGAAINFILIKDKLKFEISLGSLLAAELKASSQLLKLAILADE
jgi:hypothetical protein